MGKLLGVEMNTLIPLIVILPLLALFALSCWHSSAREARTLAFREGAYRGLDVHDAPRGKSDVRVVFPTYQGHFLFATFEPHDVWLPANQAEVLLGRLALREPDARAHRPAVAGHPDRLLPPVSPAARPRRVSGRSLEKADPR